MPRYKLTISYDGTHYVGWQVQPNGLSIQGCIEQALQTLLKKKVRLTGAGRTDAGVHALAQNAHFEAEAIPKLNLFQLSVNGLLPHDIRILAIEEVPSSFHAQYSASSKIYHYHLCLQRTMAPFTRLYRHKPKMQIDLPLLKQGAVQLIGTHDFTTFTNLGGGSQKHTRTLFRLDCIEQPEGVRLEFEGDGFGYKMVRNLVGTLLAVGSKKLDLKQIPTLFEAKDRTQAPTAAPARGLFLVRVNYL